MPVTERQRCFIDNRRFAHLATADAAGVPHVTPICFVLMGEVLYTTIDQKPKQPGGRLKRLANIEANPAVSVVLDHYDEDWSRLGWVRLDGRAEILHDGEEHARAQLALQARYSQYRTMALASLPVIAIRIGHAISWGDLSVVATGEAD